VIPIRVLLVDDHALVRQGIRTFLETQEGIEVVAEAETAAGAERMAQLHAPDVALVDLVLADGDGIEATVAVRRVQPSCRVVVLTSYPDSARLFPALRAGALSYLLKDVSMQDLVAAIRRAARGETTLHPRVAERMVVELQRTDSSLTPEELTHREREVLLLIARGLDNRDIADRLGVSEHTVKGHVSNLLGKLGVSDRTKAAVYAWSAGLISRDTEP
jgi:NarL family two-component system response regulator LiaR